MGSPQHPTKEQISILEKAGQLRVMGKPIKAGVKNGGFIYNLSLPRQAVALLKISPL